MKLKNFTFGFLFLFLFLISNLGFAVSGNLLAESPQKEVLACQSIILDANRAISDTISINANMNWTYIHYIQGESSGESDAINVLDKLEKGGGSGPDINVIAQLDRIAGYDTTNGDWTTARIYEITDDVQSGIIDSTLLVDLGEVNMGEPETLENLLDYCFTNYPANYYCLNLWGVGDAYWGCIWDGGFTPDYPHLSVNDFSLAIAPALSTHGEYLDIISLDSTYMSSFEMAYELRNYCDYYISTEDTLPLDFDYETIVTELNADPDMSPLELSEIYYDSTSTDHSSTPYSCLSVLDQSKIIPVKTCLDYLVGNVTYAAAELDNIHSLYLCSKFNQRFDRTDCIDLYGFAAELRKLFFYNSDVVTAANELIAALKDYIIYNYQHTSYEGKAHGVHIFLPLTNYVLEDPMVYAYINNTSWFTGTDLLSHTQWNEFVDFHFAEYGYTGPADPTVLDLVGTNQGGSLTTDHVDTYKYSITTKGTYYLEASISSGAIKFTVYSELDRALAFNSTELINDDGKFEFVFDIMKEGTYYVIVYGIDPLSEYLIYFSSGTPGVGYSTVITFTLILSLLSIISLYQIITKRKKKN